MLINDISSKIAAVLDVAGQIIGILDIQSPTLNAFGENDILLMEILVAQIAVTIGLER